MVFRNLLLFEATALILPLTTLLLLVSPSRATAWLIFLLPIILYAFLGFFTPRLLPPHAWMIFFAFLAHAILSLGGTLAVLIIRESLMRDLGIFALIPLTLGSLLIIPAFLTGFFIGWKHSRRVTERV